MFYGNALDSKNVREWACISNTLYPYSPLLNQLEFPNLNL